MANKFVSFLKRAGQIIEAGAQEAAVFVPALAPFVNLLIPASKQAAAVSIETKAVSEITLLSNSVMQTEAMVNAIKAGGTAVTGAQKAQAAGVAVTNILMNSEAMAGKKIGDPVAAQKAASTIAGGIADWWNAVNGNDLPNPPTPASPTV